ncbi:MAG: RNA polymerase sigma factor [Bacteroidia bacterium]|nr:RNA polymerase sigma factor [Bacteroidia bacterium]
MEKELIDSASKGDRHAFRHLVDTHQRFVLLTARRFVYDMDDAADIAQEVFLKLWNNLPGYNINMKLTTWLYKIVVNQCLDTLKSKTYRQRKASTSIDMHLETPSMLNAEQQMEDREFADIVHALCKQLTPKQQAVFILRDVEGLSVEEVMAILSMNAGNIKSNLYHARKQMHEWLKLHYEPKIQAT